MAIIKVSISKFVTYMQWCYENKCGYIMGAYGQNPRDWPVNSWWFTQYKGEQLKKALYWRAHAPQVMDCNGMVEGFYQKETGANINARARDNYATWCNPKGAGNIPVAHRVPGAAVFIYNGDYISHVGFLWKPVTSGKPEGDWWVIEARGVMYGVVATKLSERGWNRWGLMTRYFNHTDAMSEKPEAPEKPAQGNKPKYNFGIRLLRHRKGYTMLKGDDVRAVQTRLRELGFDPGKVDGKYGPKSATGVTAFQKARKLKADGIVGPVTRAELAR